VINNDTILYNYLSAVVVDLSARCHAGCLRPLCGAIVLAMPTRFLESDMTSFLD